jgi:ribosomal protein S20
MINEQELKEYMSSAPEKLRYLLKRVEKEIDKADYDSAAEAVQELHSNIIGLIVGEQFLSK